MYPYPDPDRRDYGGRPRDPRYAADFNPSQPLRQTRGALSQAATLLTPPVTTTQSLPGRPTYSQRFSGQQQSYQGPSTQWYRPPYSRHSPYPVQSSAERLNIFRPRSQDRRQRSRQAKKWKPWEHTFCCLAVKTQRLPPGPMQRGKLMTAGLGEKFLVFNEDADAEEVHFELLQAYPKLHTAGGYVTFCILMHNRFIPMISGTNSFVPVRAMYTSWKLYRHHLQDTRYHT